MKITKPGIYNLTEAEYHADPVAGGSLSSSGAKLLLPPNCPAIFAHRKTHPAAPTDAMTFGSAAHREVLGVGADLVLIDAPNWRTNAAKEKRREALAAGNIPLLGHEYVDVQAMAVALRHHPRAAELLAPGSGVAEQTMVWKTGAVRRRALVDWLRPKEIVDYKTCQRADPDSIRKAIATYGYHQQGAWYTDGAQELGLCENPPFFLIFQEKTSPYLVTVVRMDADTLASGRRANREAMDIYARCMETGHWPGYADEAGELEVSLPGWADRHDDSRAQRIG